MDSWGCNEGPRWIIGTAWALRLLCGRSLHVYDLDRRREMDHHGTGGIEGKGQNHVVCLACTVYTWNFEMKTNGISMWFTNHRLYTAAIFFSPLVGYWCGFHRPLHEGLTDGLLGQNCPIPQGLHFPLVVLICFTLVLCNYLVDVGLAAGGNVVW
jgi:hypothetical protein